jgi:hypothetical protein
MVRIRLPDTTEATLEGRRWSSVDARLERLLNAMRAPWGPRQDRVDAAAELREAQVASKVLGASIIETSNDDTL